MRSMGVILWTKHFALNDQDLYRGAGAMVISMPETTFTASNADSQPGVMLINLVEDETPFIISEWSCVYSILCAPPPHVHTFAEDWTYDDAQHWHRATCAHTAVKDALAAHDDDGADGAYV